MSLWRRLFGGRTDSGSEIALSPLHFPQVPAYHEVVFEELSVRVFAHDLFQGPTSIPCWSYVTDGLRRYGQKEFIFTLKRRDQEAVEDYPRDPLRLFSSIYNFAVQGKRVEINDYTQFKLPDGFLDHSGVVAVAYTSSERITGVNFPEYPLTAILFFEEEAALLPTIGAYRVFTRLGHQQGVYPTPLWCDRDRKPVIRKNELANSILGRVPVVNVPWGRARLTLGEGNHSTNGDKLHLRLDAIAVAFLKESLRQIPETQPFAWVMPPAEDADARLVWTPGMSGVEAIVPSDSQGTCQTGGYIAFVPKDNQPEGGQIFEDGFLLTLHRETMTKLREAFTRGERLDIAASEERIRFSLHWDYPERVGSAVEFGNGLLYQTDEVLKDRIVDRNAFNSYVSHLQSVLRRFLDLLPEARGQNLLFVSALRPGGQARFWLDILPDGFPIEWKQEIEERLRAVRVPQVSNGPVAYALFGKLWGGATSTASTQVQMIPEEWRKAAIRMSNPENLGNLDTDAILRVIWPE